MRKLGAVKRRFAALVVCTVVAVTSCASPDTPRGRPPTLGEQSPGSWWRPAVGATFHIQYAGKVDMDLPVDVYNLDHERTKAAEVTQLKDRGVASICYFNAGAYEDFRKDKGLFPREVIGEPMAGWPGENWLDVRQIDVLLPIMTARMDECKQKGFVAVDPDNTNGWSQDTGFPISPDDQIAYQRALADEAHRRGLAIGLKNDQEHIDQLADVVDFAVNEECVRYKECDRYARFLRGGKAVFHIEYRGSLANICSGRPPGMVTVKADRALNGPTKACPT